jgi:hypothetical protein
LAYHLLAPFEWRRNFQGFPLNAEEQRTERSAESEKRQEKQKNQILLLYVKPVFAFLFFSAILSFSSQRLCV